MSSPGLVLHPQKDFWLGPLGKRVGGGATDFFPLTSRTKNSLQNVTVSFLYEYGETETLVSNALPRTGTALPEGLLAGSIRPEGGGEVPLILLSICLLDRTH